MADTLGVHDPHCSLCSKTSPDFPHGIWDRGHVHESDLSWDHADSPSFQGAVNAVLRVI